jgi:hypothetical protein
MIIILIIGTIIFLVLFRSNLNKQFIINQFKKNNMIVFGKKGSGKDLLFQWVINRYKKQHYSNIIYNQKTLPIKLINLSLFPNTFDNMINDKVEKVVPNLNEKTDIFISDGGIYMPSHYDSQLSKMYPSLPIFYALQRHLYNSNTHINTQALSRIWIKVREQADGYIKMQHTIVILGIYIQSFTYYEKYETALMSINPMPKPFNPLNQQLYNQFVATNGMIKNMMVFGFKNEIKYNTRHFYKVFFKNKDTKQALVQVSPN